MIKKILLLFLYASLLVGCYHENKTKLEKPDNLLSVEELTDILTDIQLAEGIISYNRTVRMNTDNTYKDSMYSTIFSHYNIDHKTFRENINFYHNDPVLMEEIYENVLANLNKIRGDISLQAEVESAEKMIDTTETIKK